MQDVGVELDAVWPADRSSVRVDSCLVEGAVVVDGREDPPKSARKVELSDDSVIEGDLEYATAEMFDIGWTGQRGHGLSLLERRYGGQFVWRLGSDPVVGEVVAMLDAPLLHELGGRAG